jgi:hypothetical protein
MFRASFHSVNTRGWTDHALPVTGNGTDPLQRVIVTEDLKGHRQDSVASNRSSGLMPISSGGRVVSSSDYATRPSTRKASWASAVRRLLDEIRGRIPRRRALAFAKRHGRHATSDLNRTSIRKYSQALTYRVIRRGLPARRYLAQRSQGRAGVGRPFESSPPNTPLFEMLAYGRSY